MDDMLADIRRLLNFAKDVATNYDHEEYTSDHRQGYGGRCRKCAAEDVVREVLGDQAASLLRGPYYGTSPEIVATLAKMGMPTGHLPPESTR